MSGVDLITGFGHQIYRNAWFEPLTGDNKKASDTATRVGEQLANGIYVFGGISGAAHLLINGSKVGAFGAVIDIGAVLWGAAAGVNMFGAHTPKKDDGPKKPEQTAELAQNPQFPKPAPEIQTAPQPQPFDLNSYFLPARTPDSSAAEKQVAELLKAGRNDEAAALATETLNSLPKEQQQQVSTELGTIFRESALKDPKVQRMLTEPRNVAEVAKEWVSWTDENSNQQIDIGVEAKESGRGSGWYLIATRADSIGYATRAGYQDGHVEEYELAAALQSYAHAADGMVTPQQQDAFVQNYGRDMALAAAPQAASSSPTGP